MPASEIFAKFGKGTLKSGSGQKVTNRKQAIAIALSYGKDGDKAKHMRHGISKLSDKK